jgi:hypothetical protein
MEIIGRMVDGQAYPAVCASINMAPSIVTTIMKNNNTIKKQWELE